MLGQDVFEMRIPVRVYELDTQGRQAGRIPTLGVSAPRYPFAGKRLGGGMRQAGVLAAAGSYALDHHLDRLAEDHRRARQIGDALGVADVETNIVPLDLTGTAYDGPQLAAAAREQGVLLSVVGPRKVRLVTHLDLDDAGAKHAADVVARLLGR